MRTVCVRDRGLYAYCVPPGSCTRRCDAATSVWECPAPRPNAGPSRPARDSAYLHPDFTAPVLTPKQAQGHIWPAYTRDVINEVELDPWAVLVPVLTAALIASL